MSGGVPDRGAQDQQQPGQELRPYSSFGALRDPFGPMGDLSESPFGFFDSGRRGRRGADDDGSFGGLFGPMGTLFRDMDSMLMGRAGRLDSAFMNGDSGFMFAGAGNGGGSYSCQTMMMSSQVGPDGKRRTERFASSAVGDMDGKMREVQQAYANDHTGMSKMSLERQLDGRGRKVVKERDGFTGEERQTDMLRGMSESQYQEFEQDWNSRAAPRLPRHLQGVQRYMLGDGRPGQQACLPAPPAHPLPQTQLLAPPAHQLPQTQVHQAVQQEERPCEAQRPQPQRQPQQQTHFEAQQHRQEQRRQRSHPPKQPSQSFQSFLFGACFPSKTKSSSSEDEREEQQQQQQQQLKQKQDAQPSKSSWTSWWR